MTGAGSIGSSPAFPGSMLQSQKGFLSEPSKLHFTRETSEGTPLKQFHDVEEMARKLDDLLEGIEGEGGFRDASIRAQSSSVLALEEGIESVSEKCRIWRAVMDKQLGEVQLLLDKTVQVLARKVYMEEIFKQATDERYWNLWNRQKLCSELELKRQHVNEVNKSLTSQLIELERHFNTLELNKFGDTDRIQTNKRGFQSRPGQPRNFQSLHNLRNTMTTQLIVAEQLSESLSKLMTDLSIDSPAKGQNIRKELFETIGLPYDGASHKSPAREKAENTPFNKELSVFLAVKERSRRKKPSPVKSLEPETARRRRDSLDRVGDLGCNFGGKQSGRFEKEAECTKSIGKLDLGKKRLKISELPYCRCMCVAHAGDLHIWCQNVYSGTQLHAFPMCLHCAQNWASFETPKTTVKRIVLQEDRPKETSNKSSLSLDKKHHQSRMRERSATAQSNIFSASSISPEQVRSQDVLPRHAAETPPMISPVSSLQHESQLTGVTSQYGLVDTHNLATTRSGRSTIPLKDIVQTGGPGAIQQSGNRMQQPNSSGPPAQTLAPIKFTIDTSNADGKPGITKPKFTIDTSNADGKPGITKPNFTIDTSNADGKPGITKPVRDWKNAPVTSGSAQFESNSNLNYSLPTAAAAANSAFTLSAKFIHSEVVNKSQGSEISLSAQESTHSSSSHVKIMPSASLSSSQEPMLSPISSPWTSFESVSKASIGSNQKISQSSVASLTQSSSLQSTQKLDTLPITPSSDSTRSESPTILSRPLVAILDKKADTNSDKPASLANLSTKIDTPQDPASQPVVLFSVPKSQAGPLVQSNEQSPSLKSASQVHPRAESSQVSNVGLNPIPGQPFSGSSIPPSVKSGCSDVVTHEDDMEEEAPENNQMKENALGNLAGFGIGSAATPVSTKPNPFGVMSPNKASSPANSLFTSTASSSELFRPASFSFQPIQPPQPSAPANFGAFPGSFSLTSTSQAPAVSGFGQPAQVGQGQHALGSVLGTFGQSRQLGAGIPGTGVGSASSFGGGFMSNSSAGGFGGGFSNLSSGGVGFGASAAPSGGFAAAATGAGGFAAAATSAGGFGAAAAAGGGFAAPTGGGSGFSGGGFGAFSSQQSGGSGFPAFGGSSATARPPSQLFTQMRK
uniref:Nuclear pore complex protein NUP214 n=1 Tax=Solanum lycopersicum TaxID=4081 RepID=A0A3Q7EWX9_SOLLC